MGARTEIERPQIDQDTVFTAKDFAEVLGVSKATVLRWEIQDRFGESIKRRLHGFRQPERIFTQENIIEALKIMQKMENTHGYKYHPWLKNVNLSGQFEIVTPSGYTIRHEEAPGSE